MNASDLPAWLSGRFLPLSQVALGPLDAGLVFGATVTDRCRTFGRRLFRWPEHLARFRHDCTACHIPLPFPDDELTAAAGELVARVPGNAEVVLVAFATPGLPGGGPTVCLHAMPLDLARYRPFFERGVALHPAGDLAITPGGILSPRIKHRSRLVWWLADHSAPPGTLPVLHDPLSGSLTETAVGNLLVVRGGAITTPLARLVLDGVSLRVVAGLCGRLGVPFGEGIVRPEDLWSADEVLLTGTSFCLVGVSSFAGRPVSWPGPLLGRLLTAWGEEVGADIARQFLAGDVSPDHAGPGSK